VEEGGRVTTLEKLRIEAVKKILAKKNLPKDMRNYWVRVFRRISDPWKQEKMWVKKSAKTKKSLKKKDSK
jgi:hypothetical protein